MDPLLLAVDFSDATWLTIAFVAGFAAFRVGLPPLVGFLLAGFILNYIGVHSTDFLAHLADLGVTLLLFTIGLKLRVGSLLRPEIWGVATLHMVCTIVVFGAIVLGLATTGLVFFADVDPTTAFIIGFALSFSSTVFAVKTLDNTGEGGSRFGRVAIGVLIIQDIAAVIFLVISSGQPPSPWAFSLLALLLLRKPLQQLLNMSGHGELLILIGFVLAIGGAQLFEMFNLKGDLGALFVGALLAGNSRADELAKNLFGFKELFLVAFFLSIGLSGIPTFDTFLVACILLVLVPLKIALYYWLFTRFRLMASTANRASLVLANYSEFGLIVASVAVSTGWLSTDWLLVIAVALSLSFAIAAVLNSHSSFLFSKYYDFLKRFEKPARLTEDALIDFGSAQVIVLGMGRVGTSVYEEMNKSMPGLVIGVDYDETVVADHKALGRNVVAGNASNPEFWVRVRKSNVVEYVMLVMSEHNAQLAAIEQIRKRGFKGKIAATVRYPDQVEQLQGLGVEAAFNIYAEAGSGFAEHVRTQFKL